MKRTKPLFPIINEKKMFDFCNIIILGSWNTSIINPFWLTEQFPNLLKIKNKIPSAIKTELTITPAPIFRYTFNDVTIESSNERLAFITKKNYKKQLNFIYSISSSIYDKLPHTPIIAVGHNFNYKLKSEKFSLIDKFFEVDKNLEVFQSINLEEQIEQQNKYTFAFQNHILNLSLTNTNEEIIISFNYHYQIDNLYYFTYVLTDSTQLRW